MRRLYLASIAAAAIVGVGAGVLLHGRLSSGQAQARPNLPRLHGQATWAAGARPAPLFTLRNQQGRPVDLASYRGRPVVIAFMDSLCTAECPIEARLLAAAFRSVAEPPQLLVVSVDLADSPRSIAKAARTWGLPAGYEWLTGTHAQLARVWRAYAIQVLPAGNGDIAHTDAFYLVDQHGDERAGFLTPFIPGLLTHDLAVLATRA